MAKSFKAEIFGFLIMEFFFNFSVILNYVPSIVKIKGAAIVMVIIDFKF